MAVEVGVSVDDDSPKTRFVRYLYIGKEYPVYYSGTWTNQNHFTMAKVTSIVELAAEKDTELFPITKIKQVIFSITKTVNFFYRQTIKKYDNIIHF